MGDISTRISRKEFACKCGCGFMACDIDLVNNLEDIADEIQTKYQADRCYIKFNSVCRCFKYNETVQAKYTNNYKPGTSKSKHMFGMAADFYIEIKTNSGRVRKKVDPDEIYRLADSKWPKKYGLGKYSTFTHLDVRPEKARW